MKKDQKWDWIKEQDKAFRKLKGRFTKEPVLPVLNLNKKIRIEVDMSDYTMKEVLSIECEDVRYSSHLIIQDPEKYLGCPELSNLVLSENTESKSKQSSASAYMLYFYKSYRLYILDQELETLAGGEPLKGDEMCCC